MSIDNLLDELKALASSEGETNFLGEAFETYYQRMGENLRRVAADCILDSEATFVEWHASKATDVSNPHDKPALRRAWRDAEGARRGVIAVELAKARRAVERTDALNATHGTDCAPPVWATNLLNHFA